MLEKTLREFTTYHRGIYYRRFIWVFHNPYPGSSFPDVTTAYHTYPSTAGVHYSDHKTLWQNGLGSESLKPTHTYR